MSPTLSWLVIGAVVALPTLVLYCALVVSSRFSRAEERAAMHTHTCSRCGRVQHWVHEFDQWSPCRACQLADLTHIEIDLDAFADADAIRVHLNGVDYKPREERHTTAA